MKNLISRLLEDKPNRILVTGSNEIQINKLTEDIKNLLSNELNKDYQTLNGVDLIDVDYLSINKKIKNIDHLLISGHNLIHKADLLDVNFILFVENKVINATRDKCKEEEQKERILERSINIYRTGEYLNPEDFRLKDLYSLSKRFYEYWVMPQLLFDTSKNTYIIKEEDIEFK
tara:strand:+ start:518 stop:1039 length:522 start_codon:yes stop_codon:yes gene_type:complete